MTHSHKRLLVTLPVVLFAYFLIFPQSISACSCLRSPTVLDAYEGADFVVITEAVSIEKSQERYNGFSSIRMVVEKVFKGSLKVGDELTFAQGVGGADCRWTFEKDPVGQKFLFYLYSKEEKPESVSATICGRSNRLNYAADDLLYLENMDKQRGKTRISGTLSSFQPSPVEDDVWTRKLLEGLEVRLIGEQKTYTATANKDGVYEIYDLPPGKYILEPDVPRGLKLDRIRSGGSPPPQISDLPRLADKPKDGTQEQPKPSGIPLVLKAGKHAYFDFGYAIDNVIRGTVFDTQGKPIDGVCLDVIPDKGKASRQFFKNDCTKGGGLFAIDNIPAGSYLLVINKRGKISSREPFPTFYYPGVFEREKATSITIGEGDVVGNLSVHVPAMEKTITVEGVLLYSDDRPVVNEWVTFVADNVDERIDGRGGARTDASGKFSFTILKNFRGKLSAGLYVYTGQFENCPKVERLIKESGSTGITVKTNAIELDAEQDVFGLELRYPIPACKKTPVSI